MQTGSLLRDPNSPGRVDDLSLTSSPDPNDPNNPGIGVIWSDTGESSISSCVPDEATEDCLSQVYYSHLLPGGSLGTSVSVTNTTSNALRPNATWDPVSEQIELAWLDFRLGPSGFCDLNCHPAIFRQFLTEDGTLRDANGQNCGRCNEQIWSSAPIGAAGPVLGRSSMLTGYLLPIQEADGVQRKLGTRRPIDLDLLVRENPEQAQLINGQVITGSGAIGEQSGKLVAVWDEAGFPPHPKLMARAIVGPALGAPIRLLPAPSVGPIQIMCQRVTSIRFSQARRGHPRRLVV